MPSTRLARLTALLLLLAGLLPARTVPPPLPPAAQEAMEKGVIAAKNQDYLLAIRFFQEARENSPAEPILFFNLGLAESKIPGRELRAIVWFGAYLQASPTATNAPAVREQIKWLDVKNQGDLSRLIRTAQAAVPQLPMSTGYERSQAMRQVAELWAKSGDSETAIQAADTNTFQSDRDGARKIIADEQAKAGDIAAAFVTVDRIQSLYDKGWAQKAIVSAQAKTGDFAGAQRTADRIQNPEHKGLAQAAIAYEQAKAADVASAQRTADTIQHAGGKNLALYYIAWEQAKAGDIAGALKTADGILDERKGGAQAVIAYEQAKTGDITAARRTADNIQDIERRGWAQEAIASEQIKTGDIAGAQKTADGIQYASHKDAAHEVIAKAQARTKATSRIEPTREVYAWSAKNDWLLGEPAFLDLAGYLKSQPSDNPQKIFDELCYAASKISDARQVIAQMLKQQAQQSAK